MTGTWISEARFRTIFGEFRSDAFRAEYQPEPLAFERDPFDRFAAGSPLVPSEWPEWQAWLDKVRHWTQEQDKKVTTLLLLDDPPTTQQGWRSWSASYHQAAGHEILLMAAAQARLLGIRVGNWWMFDQQRVVEMEFTPDGQIGDKRLVTAARDIKDYLRWRSLALLHGLPPQVVAA